MRSLHLPFEIMNNTAAEYPKIASKNQTLSVIAYLVFFSFLNFLLISRGIGALFEFPYFLVLVIPYFWLTLKAPELGLAVYLVFLLSGIKTLSASNGDSISLSILLLICLVFAWILHFVRSNKILGLKDPISILIFLYIGANFVNTLLRRSPLDSQEEVSIKTLSMILLLYLFSISFLNSQTRILRIFRSFLFLSCIWFAMSLFHILRFGIEGVYLRTGSEGGYLGDIVGMNSLAVSALTILPFVYFQLSLKQRPFWRILSRISLALLISTVILSLSRNGFVNLIIVLAFLFFREKKSPRIWGMVAVLLIIILLTPQQYWTRIFSTSGIESYQLDIGVGIKTKWAYIQNAFGIVARSPLVGIGTGKLERSVHNSVLQVAVELGLPAMILYLTMILVAFRELRKMQRHPRADSPESLSQLPYMMMIGLVAYMIGGLTISIHIFPLLFVILALTTVTKSLGSDQAISHHGALVYSPK